MAVYTSELGIPAALIEERDACGVGFIASLNNEPRHDIIQQALSACTCMVLLYIFTFQIFIHD